MFCPNCGKEISDEVTFCPYCGINVYSSNDTEKIEIENSASNSKKQKFLIIGVSVLLASIIIGGSIFAITNKWRSDFDNKKTENKEIVKITETEKENETETEEVQPIKIVSNITEIKTEVNQHIELSYEIIGGQANEENKVEFVSGNEDIAKVDERGLVTGVSSGKTFIVAKCDGEEFFWNIEIIPAASIICSNMDISCYLGDTVQLQYQTSGGDDTYQISFISLDESIATVSEKGVIKANEVGETSISIKYGEYAVANVKVTCSIFDFGKLYVEGNQFDNDKYPSWFDEREDMVDNDYYRYYFNGQEIMVCNICGMGDFTYHTKCDYITFFGINIGDSQEESIRKIKEFGFIDASQYPELNYGDYEYVYVNKYDPQNQKDGYRIALSFYDGKISCININFTSSFSG